jgi:2-Cys peroxiredoxin 5
MPIQVGDSLPSIELMEGSPDVKINIRKLFEGKKGIIFGVPGAFTPGCDKTHLPGYVEDYDQFKAKGIDEIVCISVNDPFVMKAWGDSQKATGKIRMLADTCANFTKSIDLAVDLTEKLGGIKSKRYSMVVEDGIVTVINVEGGVGTGLTCSLSNKLLDQL